MLELKGFERENSGSSAHKRLGVVGCKPPWTLRLVRPGASGQSPACWARYSPAECGVYAEHGWYRGTVAFVPFCFGAGAYFYLGEEK